MSMSPLKDPLKEWPNDDLLLDAKSRERFAAARPQLARVLDWPELRAAFAALDRKAINGKRWSRRQGVAAVLLSGLGVILLASAALIAEDRQGPVSGAALALMFLGGTVGILHGGILGSRHDWLGSRFWTERLRQLHFQSVVANLPLFVRAMNDDAALEELRRQRAIWLEELLRDVDDPRIPIREVLDDTIEKNIWIRREWDPVPAPPEDSPQLAELFEGLRRQRIGIQWTYSQKNLGNDVYAAPMRDRVLRQITSVTAFSAIAIAGIGLLCVVTGGAIMGLDLTEWTFVAAVLSAIGLMAQSLNQGLQTQTDMERYNWYAEEIDDLRGEFENGDTEAKIAALRRLERASYVEMRQFLRIHTAARFAS